ncbi:PREDICTED: uncharacterized protein LOC109347808 isoform X1 [Lupinus angustifolius]|nr:PREDICTED: uncharacterized protein LOC109347808 isoform X1 [Lupinus angustifolius]XP_019443426.1 PREDICTED: uncharacterized protein LOC109347808 isoform X1 [Lupinus angustifolius]
MVVMTCRLRKLLRYQNNFRTTKHACLYLNSMPYHSSQDVFDSQWYRNEFSKLTKLTELLANVDAINGRLVDINSNSVVFDDQTQHDMSMFKSLVRVFIASPFVQKKMRHDSLHHSFTPFGEASERYPMVVDSLTKISNFLNVSAQQRKIVRFKLNPQVTQHHIWIGALEEILNSLRVDLESPGLNKVVPMGQQIIHSCLKFLTESVIVSDPDSASWIKLSHFKNVCSSNSPKWEELLDMFNDLIKCFKSEARLKLHVDKVEVMKEGLFHIRDVLLDNSVGYKEARRQESLVHKRLSKNLGHSSRCLFTLLLYYLYGKVADIEVDVCGGIQGNGRDNKFHLFMGKILTSNNEMMVGRGVKQLDRALGLFKHVWEAAEMKGDLDLQGHMWCVGAEDRVLKYRGNMYFMHGICL